MLKKKKITKKNKNKSNPQRLPSVSVAESILLKKRNSQMNGCAAVSEILFKSNSLEVRLDCFHK